MLQKAPSGLTLLELVIALTILGVIVSIAGLHFARFSSAYRLHQASREMTSDLQFARLLAVKENRDIRVSIRVDGYEVMRAADHSVVKSRSLAQDYPAVQLSGPSVTFNSRGIASPATITVSHFMGTRQIHITATGQVQYP